MERIEIQVIMRSDRDGYMAHGEYDGKGITVLKGSQLSVTDQDKRDVQALRKIGLDENGRLLEDRYFKTPTAASIFVCGKPSDGWEKWLTPEGLPLATFRDMKSDNDSIKEDHGSEKATHEFESAHEDRKVIPKVATPLQNENKQELEAIATSDVLRTKRYKTNGVPSIASKNVHSQEEHFSKELKMLLCSDIRLGAESPENLDIQQSKKWRDKRKAKFTELIDKAAQNNALYVLIFGRLFGEDRVSESIIDTLFESTKQDPGIQMLAFVCEGEYKRIFYRSDIPDNFHLINIQANDSFLDDNIALRINNGTIEIQLGDNTPLHIKKDSCGMFAMSGMAEQCNIPSFEPTCFEDAQDRFCGYGILKWTKEQLIQYTNKENVLYNYKTVELKILPEDDQQEILHKINNAIKTIAKDTFLRVTITGRSAFGLTMSSDALKNQLQNRVFFVEVYDNTVMDIDEESFENDISLRSEFVRLALQDGSLSESERNRLISLGWNALSGREVSAE